MSMKQDLDHLMQERGLDTLVVAGKMLGNPALYYMVNGAKVGGGFVIQVRGQEPVFVCYPIEREEAAASGLRVVTTNHYGYGELARESPDRLSAEVELYRRIFADLGVRGQVGFYGTADRGSAWLVLNRLDEQLEDVEVHGDHDQTPIDLARATKDAAEAERIRQVGQRTAAVVGQTLEFLQSHQVVEEVLVEASGQPLTIGRVHQQIGHFVAEHQLDSPEGFTFSIGRDAGIPHNTGNPMDLVKLGQTIVFDIFPREAGGGYFFDMTRTFCLGYAAPEVEKAYRDLYDCQQMILAAYEVGTETRHYQRLTCEFLEGRGHPTIGSDPQTEDGYVHSLGHGIGLAIHEEPYFQDIPSYDQILQPGHVFTCEPGLYYPDRGYGLRIEDVVWIDPQGAVHNLTDFTKELVVPIR
jgi:Xaa-Pro aminopeptidase